MVCAVCAIRFILLMPWGRVGSNLLFAILQKSAPMKTNNEALNQLRTAQEQNLWFKEFYEIGEASPSRPHIGSKQNLLAIRELDAFSQLLHENAVRIIRLRRDNLVKAAVSQMRAEQYAEKTRNETGRPRWAIRNQDEPLGMTALDPATLIKRIALMESLQSRLMAAFGDETVLDIEYEELNASLVLMVERARTFLRLPQKNFDVPFVKATPHALSEAIANYAEIRERLAETRWQAQLES